MILKDLLPKTNFEEIWSIILKYWPNQDVNKSGYEMVYAQLKDIEPSVETEGDEYLLQVEIESFDDGDCLIAHGIEYVEGQEYPNYYALEYIPWSEWLGCTMEKETVDNLSPNEIYAGCLFEMTWCGFTEKKRTEARERLEHLCSGDCFDDCSEKTKKIARMTMFEDIEFGDKYVTIDGEMMVFVYFFADHWVFIDSKGNKYEYLSDGICVTQKIERFDGASVFLSEDDKILKTIVGRYYVQSPGESLGNHLRNILGPLQTLIEVVEECDKNPDDEVSKKILKKLIQKGLQGYMDKIVEFSKIDKMESEVWRYY